MTPGTNQKLEAFLDQFVEQSALRESFPDAKLRRAIGHAEFLKAKGAFTAKRPKYRAVYPRAPHVD
jgi:hypothetical protein